MRVKTPLGLFVAIVGVGIFPAAGIGSAIGVSVKDYDPIPAPSSSAEVREDFGVRDVEPTTSPKGRVASVKPTTRTPNRVTPTTVKVYKTPHARRDTPDVQNRVEPPEETTEPTSSPAPKFTKPEPSGAPHIPQPTKGPITPPPGQSGGGGASEPAGVAP
jgi:hypothetical protein